MSDQAGQEPSRRAPEAASVDRRWWEDGAAVESPLRPQRNQAEPLAATVVPPPPPPPPTGPWATTAVATTRSVPPLSSPPGWTGQPGSAPLRTELLVFADIPRIQHLEQQLDAQREEAASLQALLEELPEIFERKFRQRLQGIQEQQQLLLEENQLLREQLYTLLPLVAEAGARQAPALPEPAAASEAAVATPSDQPLRALLHSLGRFGSGLGPGSWSASSQAGGVTPAVGLSQPPDGGPPTAA